MRQCSAAGCSRPHAARGYCHYHYDREYRLKTVTTCKRCSRSNRLSTTSARVKGLCTACYNEEKRVYRAANIDKHREWTRKGRYPRKYGITLEQYEAMVADRNGQCDICGEVPAGARKEDARLHVDHDHVTGVVRGLLCRFCNLGLGRYERFHTEIDAYLRAAASMGGDASVRVPG